MRDPVKRLFSDFWYFCSMRKSKGDMNVPHKYSGHPAEVFHNYTVQTINKYVACVEGSASEFECVSRAARRVGRLNVLIERVVLYLPE